MQIRTKNRFFLPGLIAAMGFMLIGQATAQTFTTLHTFGSFSYETNSDGAEPVADLDLSGSTLYGTAYKGGTNGVGTVFKLNTDGTDFTNLHTFMANSGYPSYANIADGAFPAAEVILSGNILYGTTQDGGTNDNGAVFAINTDGSDITVLHSFSTTTLNAMNYGTNWDGGAPQAALILSGNTLYGTTVYGGTNGNGTVFAVNTDGTDFTILHTFTAFSGVFEGGTNNDGANPYVGLDLSGGVLYGVASLGGTNGVGTVFKLNTNGTGFMVLHSFAANSGYPSYTNIADGTFPDAEVILSDNTLYGTTEGGGTNDSGTVFAVNTNGTGFTVLHNFTAADPYPSGTNIDGSDPSARLILSGNTLYGTAYGGGTYGGGTVFAVNTNGAGFTTLHNFTAFNSNSNNDGAWPCAGLVYSGNTLYGTARNGGTNGGGTVFSISLAPQLTIMLSGANAILTWPTNAAGFTLQSTTNLVSTAAWTTLFPAPVVVNMNNTVTNTISGTQKFYRLSQ